MTLELHNVQKTFPGGTVALKATDLSVTRGEILSLLGPSGCGKSTLLRCIAGLEMPDAGSVVRFDGRDVTGLAVEKRNVGMVFQSYALFPNMSVRKNIGYGLKMKKLARAEIDARVDEVVGMCQLEPYVDREITALSGGQRQRVALARAFAPRPDILLLDEPLSALDAALRDALRDELAVLLRRFGITAIFVTHDQDEAMAIADRVAVMSDGEVAQIGTPEELYRTPRTRFVAQFVGNAMELKGQALGTRLTLPGGVLDLDRAGEGHSAFVRAEDVHLDPAGPISGRVETVTFLGDTYRIGISGATDGLLFASHRGLSAPAVGDTVNLSIAPSALMLLAEGA